MFEKSLYDLIRGLRNHKGDEIEYIQNSIKECRVEVRSQDMDVKATALLKLTYLEMFGYDMSWASFNVLEVMSSTKYAQKRVGYLGAVQSFRPDTEVLMLATNLLKKDLTSSSIPNMSLPLLTLPHIITPSLALSLLSDLLPRLSHSQPAVRKKTIVTLYRLALVYPEALRVSWPKIKERLMDEAEDSSVIAAIINVVCELGWRRPQDFLPLAPKFFDLLVDGGNNWMAIKIIKLFATLTPLEPRLVKKLLRPLTNIIQTTSAMSLLYECINGVIQGGILDGAEGIREGDEIADLCVSKLRGMIALEGDPNLKYVALLAFNRIVVSHPHLVSLQQDVIMDCLDDPDISIRLQALDLVSGMVDPDNLQSVVTRLMKQLQSSPLATNEPPKDHGAIEPAADSEGENPEEKLDLAEKRSSQPPPLPNDYRTDVIRRIIAICSKDIYANITDFEWYMEILVQLVRAIPPSSKYDGLGQSSESPTIITNERGSDVAFQIGSEIRNVAVRVKSVRLEATRAAESLILVNKREDRFPQHGGGAEGVLEPVVWVVGEYAEDLAYPNDTLSSLIHPTSLSLPPGTLSSYLQAIPKVFILLSCDEGVPWEAARKTTISLLLARIVHFLEDLATHPSLEVQERSIEFLELLRLAGEAVGSAEVPGERPPLFLATALTNLFSGMELNPVASGAQKKVPRPGNIDLDIALNEKLSMLLQMSDADWLGESDQDEPEKFYSVRDVQQKGKPVLTIQVEEEAPQPGSYQNLNDDSLGDPRTAAQRKADLRAARRERNKDDPFYIANDDLSSGRSTPIHGILKDTNGEDLDVDSIPIIDLDLGSRSRDISPYVSDAEAWRKKKPKARKVEIARDETLDLGDVGADGADREASNHLAQPAANRAKKSLLQVDSSGLGALSIEGQGDGGDMLQLDIERREAEEAEMAKAMAEVERLRLEMQRASERIEAAQGIPADGTLVKRKKKKKATSALPAVDQGEASGVSGERNVEGEEPGDVVVKKKKKKKRVKEPLAGDT